MFICFLSLFVSIQVSDAYVKVLSMVYLCYWYIYHEAMWISGQLHAQAAFTLEKKPLVSTD